MGTYLPDVPRPKQEAESLCSQKQSLCVSENPRRCTAARPRTWAHSPAAPWCTPSSPAKRRRGFSLAQPRTPANPRSKGKAASLRNGLGQVSETCYPQRLWINRPLQQTLSGRMGNKARLPSQAEQPCSFDTQCCPRNCQVPRRENIDGEIS